MSSQISLVPKKAKPFGSKLFQMVGADEALAIASPKEGNLSKREEALKADTSSKSQPNGSVASASASFSTVRNPPRNSPRNGM